VGTEIISRAKDSLQANPRIDITLPANRTAISNKYAQPEEDIADIVLQDIDVADIPKANQQTVASILKKSKSGVAPGLDGQPRDNFKEILRSHKEQESRIKLNQQNPERIDLHLRYFVANLCHLIDLINLINSRATGSQRHPCSIISSTIRALMVTSGRPPPGWLLPPTRNSPSCDPRVRGRTKAARRPSEEVP
jgi:hypothetical protein